jgi:L-alanine-DL-glutamate epimerase-like enolase superfamily enzyme
LGSYGRNMDAVVQWMGLPGFGSPGSLRTIRYSGVLAAGTLKKTMRQLRLMYWGGLRSFKLKVGFKGDLNRLMRVAEYLHRGIDAGRVTLRVDANGAWSFDEAKEWLTGASRLPLSAVEQPLAKGQDALLGDLKKATRHALMYDESLATMADAERLVALGVADAFNIRISKCGGLMASLRLAAYARRHNVRIQLGSMVGETSVLSAGGLRFLEVCPRVEWVEGCFGSFLLKGDVTRRSLRFGFGGRPPRLEREGLGVDVDDNLIARYGGDRSMDWEC